MGRITSGAVRWSLAHQARGGVPHAMKPLPEEDPPWAFGPQHRKRNTREWLLSRDTSFTPGKKGFNDGCERKLDASSRLTVAFRYVGPVRSIGAGNFGLLWRDREKRAIRLLRQVGRSDVGSPSLSIPRLPKRVPAGIAGGD